MTAPTLHHYPHPSALSAGNYSFPQAFQRGSTTAASLASMYSDWHDWGRASSSYLSRASGHPQDYLSPCNSVLSGSGTSAGTSVVCSDKNNSLSSAVVHAQTNSGQSSYPAAMHSSLVYPTPEYPSGLGLGVMDKASGMFGIKDHDQGSNDSGGKSPGELD